MDAYAIRPLGTNSPWRSARGPFFTPACYAPGLPRLFVPLMASQPLKANGHRFRKRWPLPASKRSAAGELPSEEDAKFS